MYPLDIFAYLLANKLAYQPHERDMVVLSHELVTNHYQTRKTQVHTSSLIVYGTPEASAMARTVGIPIAIAALAVLDGKIYLRGVHGPVKKNVNQIVLEGLRGAGLALREETKTLDTFGMLGPVEAALVNAPGYPGCRSNTWSEAGLSMPELRQSETQLL
ncbi:hypothetical protein H0H87_008926 [Tephrocybe sp. NHM501043]|nr:hypothetical protein H0H87_008926 [Tephrocybe sp. NHM501043]